MKQFILHLSLIDGIGPASIQAINMYVKRSDVSASDLYSFLVSDWVRECGVTERAAQLLVVGLSDKTTLENELALISRHNIKWVTIADEQYPALLREIHIPPSVLYWQGGDFNDEQKNIAIVGSRKSNFYGQRVVNALVPGLVGAGHAIVSGGALGIDAMAHDATLKAGGKTIVVLGSGLLNLYPATNKRLFAAIRENNGLLVSSFPLMTEPKPGNFPARNRIIAGLSHGCLVVQAAKKSGSLITAQYALEQGREVFAVPGPIDDELSVGCNMLIQQGAKLVVTADDIINEYGSRVIIHDVYAPIRHVQQALFAVDELTPVQKQIIHACKQPVPLDEIVAITALDFSVVQAELFDLQLAGKVQQDFLGMWVALI
jgi:DNA processing protein